MEPNTSSPEIENQNPKKKFPSYLMILFILAAAGVAALGYSLFSTESGLESAAAAELKAIREGNIAKAYRDLGSKELREKYSIDEFIRFLNAHQILKDYKEVSFTSEKISKNRGTLAATLTPQEGSAQNAYFHFIQESSQWKISDIQFPQSTSDTITQPAPKVDQEKEQLSEVVDDPAELNPVVEAQLKELRAHDVEKAYKDYTSKGFQKATNLDAFRNFVKLFPVLVDHKSFAFGRGGITHEKGADKGTLIVTLISDTGSYPVEYSLIKESGKWKIWGLKFLSQEKQSSETTPDEREEIITVIREQLNLLKQDQIEESYNLYASKAFKNTTSPKEFKDFVRSYPEMLQFDSFRFGESVKTEDLRQVKVFLDKNGRESALDYWMVKEGDPEKKLWKIRGLQVESSLTYPSINEEEMQKLSGIVKNQLEALKEGDLSKAYYAFASSEFEKDTSFDDFKKYVAAHPIFTGYDSYKIVEGIVRGELRLIRLKLEKDGQTDLTDYWLVEENGRWKIWGIQILDNPRRAEEQKKQKEVHNTIQAQLEAIQSKDLSKAYYAYTSHTFQDMIAKDSFENFIEEYPALENIESFKIRNIVVNNTEADANVKAISKEANSIFIYHLIFDGNKWKVDSVRIERSNSDFQGQKTKFGKVLLGTKIDAQGKIVQSESEIQNKDDNIAINLFIKRGKQGETVNVVLNHIPSGEKTAAFSSTIESDGDAIASFLFTAPPQGWPEGEYGIEAETSSGASQELKFTVGSPRA